MELVLRKKSHFIVLAICSVLILLPLAYSSSVAEIDITATFYKVVDGDTFDTSRGRIRLADVDAPDNDSGYHEAKDFLGDLFENAPHKQLYLDIDY